MLDTAQTTATKAKHGSSSQTQKAIQFALAFKKMALGSPATDATAFILRLSSITIITSNKTKGGYGSFFDQYPPANLVRKGN
jgi:hypothetical protein